MATKTQAQLTSALTTSSNNTTDTISNTNFIEPLEDRAVRLELNLIVQDIIDSMYNKSNGITIPEITGLVATLAGKENADVNILKRVNVVNNLITTSTDVPLSANQGKILKDLIDGLPSLNTATVLNQGGANEVTAAEIRTHISDATRHFVQSEIDHTLILNKGTNTHAQIDSHIADTTRHFTQAEIDHTNILNRGSNTHAQIDSHIANTSNPHATTLIQSITAQSLSVGKGSLYVADGTTAIAVAPGSNGQVLQANSSTVSGLEWVAPVGEANVISSVGGGTSLYSGKSGSTLNVRSVGSANNMLAINLVGDLVEFTVQVANIAHQSLSGAGTNTHAQIDAHIAASNPHGLTFDDLSPTTTQGDLLVYNGSQTVRLGKGTAGQVLVAGVSTVQWSDTLTTVSSHVSLTNNPHQTTITQATSQEFTGVPGKGTILVSNGTAVVTLPPGSNGQVLKANAATASGLEYSADIGQANTGANLSATGQGFYSGMNGTVLEFKRLYSSNNSILVEGTATQVSIRLPEQAALTPQLSTITQAGSFTPDYDIQALTSTTPWGFASQNEAETTLSVIRNLQIRVAELEARLKLSTILPA